MSRKTKRALSFERNNFLRNGKRFSALRASPFSLGSVSIGNPSQNNFVLPAPANIAISFSASITTGDLTVSSGSRTITVPTSSPGQIRRLGYFEKGKSLLPSSLIAGDVTLYYFDQDFLPSAIASGTFV